MLSVLALSLNIRDAQEDRGKNKEQHKIVLVSTELRTLVLY